MVKWDEIQEYAFQNVYKFIHESVEHRDAFFTYVIKYITQKGESVGIT